MKAAWSIAALGAASAAALASSPPRPGHRAPSRSGSAGSSSTAAIPARARPTRGEVIVCARRPDTERYRIPSELRDSATERSREPELGRPGRIARICRPNRNRELLDRRLRRGQRLLERDGPRLAPRPPARRRRAGALICLPIARWGGGPCEAWWRGSWRWSRITREPSRSTAATPPPPCGWSPPPATRGEASSSPPPPTHPPAPRAHPAAPLPAEAPRRGSASGRTSRRALSRAFARSALILSSPIL